MRDTDVFRTLLGLAHPWRIDRVGLSPEEKQLDLWLVHHPRASFCCPDCGRARPLYDHVPSRTWRHLDHGDYRTWLHARRPRVQCSEHGTRQALLPWALPGTRYT